MEIQSSGASNEMKNGIQSTGIGPKKNASEVIEPGMDRKECQGSQSTGIGPKRMSDEIKAQTSGLESCAITRVAWRKRSQLCGVHGDTTNREH